MLLRAMEKEGGARVKWNVHDAMHLSYPDESFDAVYMSHLLHHVDDPVTVVSGCYRILRRGWIVLNRYGAIENILDDPEHRFFPQAVEIDKVRTPTVKQAEEWFVTAGFNNVFSETVIQQTYRSAEERLEKAKLKSTSVLTLIS